MRNCEKGDMAIIVRSNAGNAGEIVTCLEWVGKLPEGTFYNRKTDYWLIDKKLRVVYNIGGEETGYFPYLSDSMLMPISPSDDQISEFSSEDDKEIDFELTEFYGNTLALIPKRKEGA